MPNWFHRNYMWIFGVASGIVFYQKLSAFYLMLLLLLVAAGALTYYRNWRALSVLLIALFLGFLSSWINDLTAPTVLLKGHWHDQQMLVCDSGAIGEALHKDELLPDRVIAQTRINGKTVRVQLRFPYELENPGLAEGEVWSVTGNFYQPEAPCEFFMADDSGDWHDVSCEIAQNSYQKYLQLHGISGVVIVRKLQRCKESDSFFSKFKRYCAERLDRGISEPVRKSVLSAVTLGLRARLPSGIKQQFSKLGIAHLFSVSGLHVGVLALLLLFALRPLPAFWHWLITSTLIFYVFLTGGNAPAIRAFAMLWLVEFFKSRCLHIPLTQLLSLIAAGILLFEPDYLSDGGFQYSFVITFMLLLAGRPAADIMHSASGAGYWWGELPRWKKYLLKMRGGFCAALFFAAVAALTSTVLMLVHQNIFFAGTMLVNFLILPILTPLFVVAICKCMFAWGDGLWNFLLDKLLDYLMITVDFSESFTARSNWVTLHWLTAAIFIVLLALLLIGYKSKYSCLLAAGLFAVIGFQLLLPMQKTPQAAVVVSGGALTEPVAAIMLPAAENMYLLNCGNDAVIPLDQLAYYYGVTRVERLDIGRLNADCVDGIAYLQEKFPVAKFRRVPGKIRSRRFEELTGNLELLPGAERGKLSVDGLNNDLEVKALASGHYLLKYNNCEYTLKRTSRPRVYIVEQK